MLYAGRSRVSSCISPRRGSTLQPSAFLFASPLGTAFTYQGHVQQAGVPINGPCDFQFSLWDAASGGSLIGATQTVSSVSVSNGLFTVTLDFGAGAFNADARWLGISARPGGNPNYTLLSPRQPMTAAPQAIAAAVPEGAITSTKLATDSASLAKVSGGLIVCSGGNVGIGTNAPQQKLHVNGGFALVQGLGNEQAYLGGDGSGGDAQFGSLNPNVNEVHFVNVPNSSFMEVRASAFRWANCLLADDQGGAIKLGDSSLSGTTPYIDFRYGIAGSEAYNVRLINDGPGLLSCSGTFRTCILTITGGCDISEPFAVSSRNIPKGAVVVIDDQNPGALKLSDRPYDKRVAGVISGANGVNPGITLSQKGVLDGEQQVALTGRVYVQADTSNGPIEPGDLLTTSATPGHAMKVTDHAQAQGAVFGKAMSALKEGKGMVLVLVGLQ
jgi:hypothetical protein